MTVNDFIRIKAPDLYSDPDKNTWINSAQNKINRCYFGSNYNEAVALQAAHEWSLTNTRSNGESGAISSKREGDLSISYSTTGKNDNLNLTHYGKQLIDLRNRSNLSIGVLGCNTDCNTSYCN